jgi:hypothetical protein
MIQEALTPSTPFKPTEMGSLADYMALPPALVNFVLERFTFNQRGGALGSIGISDSAIAATDKKNLVIIGDLTQSVYRTTDPHRVALECDEASIYGRSFDAAVLIPDDRREDLRNLPSADPYPDVSRAARNLDAMEFITEISPDVLNRIAGMAKAAGAKRVKLLRSVEDPNIFGFQCHYVNFEPEFGEAPFVPIMGIVTGTLPVDKKSKGETVVHNLQFSKNIDINDVIRFAVEKGKVSPATIQKQFKVGEVVAKALIDQLVDRKVVSETPGAKDTRKCIILAEAITEFLDESSVKKTLDFVLEAPHDPRSRPPVELFAMGEVLDHSEDIDTPRAKINEILQAFKVDGSVNNVHVGPTITRFEIGLGATQSVGKVAKLGDDIQLRMEAERVRIEAPIPGKAAIGIELPNQTRRTVRIREVLNSEFYSHPGGLVAALGVDVAGKPIFAELEKMPHLLIAGTTGSGKSVGLTSLLTSLLMRNGPDTLRLMLVDPKRVEMMPFSGLPHLVTPVITESNEAIEALEKMGEVMEERYKLLEETGVRNLAAYNEKEPSKALPYIVIVIDELADFMMTGDKDRAESAIVRIAQKARAVGIHMVIATQRPSVEVITGTIKANIPSRIAFTVPSQIDSRTIIDGKGAEQLCGRGDMLFMPAGSNPTRVQGCFVSDAEVEELCAFWKV